MISRNQQSRDNHSFEQPVTPNREALIRGAETLQSAIETDYRIELIRKAIHLCSLSIAVVYYYTPRPVALATIIPVTVAFIVIDVTRHFHQPIGMWFYNTFGWLLRKHETNREKKTLNGATYVLIAATLCVLIFPKIIGITAFVILIISDMTSALVGRRYGKHRFLGNKTVEGTLAFFVSAVIIIVLTPKVTYVNEEYLIGFLASAIGAIVEALPIQVDDNLTVPISVGVSLWIGYVIICPTINVYTFG